MTHVITQASDDLPNKACLRPPDGMTSVGKNHPDQPVAAALLPMAANY